MLRERERPARRRAHGRVRESLRPMDGAPATCYTGAGGGRGDGSVLQRLYDWTMGLAAHRHAMLALAAISFIESSVFPIPPDVLLIPMGLAARERAWIIAGVCTLASVVGGYAGYAIGLFLYESVGQPILEFYGAAEQFAEFRGLYREWGAWIV